MLSVDDSAQRASVALLVGCLCLRFSQCNFFYLLDNSGHKFKIQFPAGSKCCWFSWRQNVIPTGPSLPLIVCPLYENYLCYHNKNVSDINTILHGSILHTIDIYRNVTVISLNKYCAVYAVCIFVCLTGLHYCVTIISVHINTDNSMQIDDFVFILDEQQNSGKRAKYQNKKIEYSPHTHTHAAKYQAHQCDQMYTCCTHRIAFILRICFFFTLLYNFWHSGQRLQSVAFSILIASHLSCF